jgi:hypothetical protein
VIDDRLWMKLSWWGDGKETYISRGQRTQRKVLTVVVDGVADQEEDTDGREDRLTVGCQFCMWGRLGMGPFWHKAFKIPMPDCRTSGVATLHAVTYPLAFFPSKYLPLRPPALSEAGKGPLGSLL